MNDYLDIFSDVVLIATFQPRLRERIDPMHRLGETGPGRPRFVKPSGRHTDIPVRT